MLGIDILDRERTLKDASRRGEHGTVLHDCEADDVLTRSASGRQEKGCEREDGEPDGGRDEGAHVPSVFL
jgi:hypothetical protein